MSVLRLTQAGSDPRQSSANGADRRPRWALSWMLAAWRRWRGEDECMHALAALDDDDLCHLSEAGRELRRRAGRQVRP